MCVLLFVALDKNSENISSKTIQTLSQLQFLLLYFRSSSKIDDFIKTLLNDAKYIHSHAPLN
jgi:hypothetical protein